MEYSIRNTKLVPALKLFWIIILTYQAYPLIITRYQTRVTALNRRLPVNIMINKAVLFMFFDPTNIIGSEDPGCIWFSISIRDDMIKFWA